jgi:hypothetical protein
MAGLPSVIGPYRVVRQLGRGGMGTVYEAIDDRIDRHVAVKLLHPQFVQDPEITRRMFNEARAANQIAHPGMALISEFGQTPEGTPYLVMEFLSGPTLRERLAGPPLTLADILDIATQMASTLLAVHQKGIVHRVPSRRQKLSRDRDLGWSEKRSGKLKEISDLARVRDGSEQGRVLGGVHCAQ